MTEMIRELMIQSVGAFLAIFGFSLLVDMPRKYLVSWSLIHSPTDTF